MRYLLLTALLTLAACSGVQQFDTKDTPTFALADAKTMHAGLMEYVQGKKGAFILRAAKGDELKVKLNLDIPGLTFIPAPATVRLDRDVFVYYSGSKLFLSPDGKDWACINDIKALRSLFGLGKGGTFQVGAGVSEAEGAILSIGLGAR